MNEPSNLRAALWMMASIACFLSMSVAGRTATAVLDVFQVLEMRSLIGLLWLSPLIYAAGGLAAMKTSRPIPHFARNAVHYSGQFAWLYALSLIPLAELISIEFTTPIWTALLAVIFLGERMSRPKIVAVVLGLIGALVIVRPGVRAIEPGHLIMLAGAVSFGVSIVLAKSLTRTESTVRIIFWMLVIQSAIGIIPAIWVWRWPPIDIWPAIAVVAFTGTFSHYCLVRALSYADATFVMPIDFLRLPLSALIGWLIYSEGVDAFTIGGAGLILLGNLANLQRRAPLPATTAP